MYRYQSITCWIVLTSASLANAQQPPISLERLTAIRSDLDRVEKWIRETDQTGEQDRIQKAARELEKAGRPDWAAAIRSGSANREIDIRRKKIAQLQAEIDQLQRDGRVFNPREQFVVNVQILEADVEKLREIGFGFDELLKKQGETSFQVVDAKDVFQVWFEQMRELGAAKVVSQPTILTEFGRPAAIFIGGEFPVAVSDKKSEGVELIPYGLKISVEGKRLDRGLNLQVNAEQTTPNLKRVESTLLGKPKSTSSPQVLRHFGVKAISEVKTGEAIFIYANKEHVEKGQKAVLMLIEASPIANVAESPKPAWR